MAWSLASCKRRRLSDTLAICKSLGAPPASPPSPAGVSDTSKEQWSRRSSGNNAQNAPSARGCEDVHAEQTADDSHGALQKLCEALGAWNRYALYHLE